MLKRVVVRFVTVVCPPPARAGARLADTIREVDHVLPPFQLKPKPSPPGDGRTGIVGNLKEAVAVAKGSFQVPPLKSRHAKSEN